MRLPTLLCGLVLMAGIGCDRGSHPQEIGRPAPDFNISDGTSAIHLASFRGRVVLVNFWWSHCPPCIVELPSLEELHHTHPEYPILGVNIDAEERDYRQFVKERHVDFLTVRDPKETAASQFEVTGWPETFVIDRNGVIRRRFIGATDWNDPEILHYLKTL
jgi:cytochrome c biogenesis protein CcmG, thiol:disulfide interchange protein DsbE